MTVLSMVKAFHSCRLLGAVTLMVHSKKAKGWSQLALKFMDYPKNLGILFEIPIKTDLKRGLRNGGQRRNFINTTPLSR